VEGLAGEIAARREGRGLPEVSPLAPGVERVADECMTLVGHVDPDLVGSARHQPAVDQAGPVPAFFDGEDGSGWATILDNGHPLTVLRMTVDGRIDHALTLRETAVAHGEIGLAHLTPAKCQSQRLVRPVRFRHDHEPGSVLVETVDDSWARNPTDPREIIAMVEKGIDERTAGIPGGRVNDQAGRFVDDQKLRVLVHDRKRQIFGGKFEGLGFRLVDHESVTLGNQGGRFRPAVVVKHSIVVDQASNSGSGPALGKVGEATIESRSSELGWNREGVDPAHARPRRLIHQCIPAPIAMRATEII